MKDEQTLIRTVNGKTVYLLKITDQIATKVNHLSDNLRNIDSTLKSWTTELNKFGKNEKCHYDSSLEFYLILLSKQTKFFHPFYVSLKYKIRLTSFQKYN